MTVGPATQCTATLAVDAVQTRAGCTIDERVSGRQATLQYGCGDGPATAAFGESVFQGAVSQGVLDLSIETIFDFTDGCRWRSKQRIAGPIGGGALRYEYDEQPDPGQTGCAAGCSADGAVQLLP